MKLLFLVILFYLPWTQASANSRFLVDYEYQCQKSVKGYNTDEFTVDTSTQYELKVGNKREIFLFAFEMGGPWFSLQEKNSGDLMVFGITECQPYGKFISVDSTCTNKISYDDEGYGYYWGGSNWKRVTEPRSLPSLYNNNLSFARGFWNGDAEATFSTTGFTEINNDLKSYVTLWSCERSL